ncbi:MAG: universal stress protein [Desulfovibrionaceae bacterium]
MKKCLVCLDGSKTSLRALARALDEAGRGADVLAVTAVEALAFFDCTGTDCQQTFTAIMREPKKILAEAEELARQRGLTIRTRIEPGRPAETIARIARQEQCDEIILGSRGKDEVQNLLLGSVSTRLVQIAPCTVVVVR